MPPGESKAMSDPGVSAHPGHRRALARYIVAWIVGGACVALILVALLRDESPETVSLPPVERTQLRAAADAAGCDLRRARPGEGLNPPVNGAAGGRPAAAGFYDEAPAIASLIAAMRRGIIVVHFRADLDDMVVEELRAIQRGIPTGTIVTANTTRMPYAVAAAAYRRLLGCPRFTPAARDALRLFRGRFVGSGPDS
jgi:hypothetical protein